ncbi:hypothetical protein HAX54_036771 [Datura stramonium]|uniref:Uncharacterized protein n=1 Tax=Datura stramonium TaxID=4076 RepID=A0ABS8RMW1_DATST|nr:hypothetical protein [Datura stramonium]
MEMDFPYNVTQFGRCLNANEAIHWLGHKIGGGPSTLIAFDMIEDKFREIRTQFDHHKTVDYYKQYHRKLALLNETCYLSYSSTGYLSFQVWALNDYGSEYTFEMQPIGFMV